LNGLDQQQKDVRTGMIAGGLFSLVWVWMGYGFLQMELPLWLTTGDRLAYVAKCELFAALMLLFGVMAVAGQRFFSRQAIEGQSNGVSRSLSINLRYIQNTLEQLVLLVIAHMAFAAVAGRDEMRLIPVLVSLFMVGRICFWIGYHQNPVSRAFGFAATFYPTAVMMFYASWRILAGA